MAEILAGKLGMRSVGQFSAVAGITETESEDHDPIALSAGFIRVGSDMVRWLSAVAPRR